MSGEEEQGLQFKVDEDIETFRQLLNEIEKEIEHNAKMEGESTTVISFGREARLRVVNQLWASFTVQAIKKMEMTAEESSSSSNRGGRSTTEVKSIISILGNLGKLFGTSAGSSSEGVEARSQIFKEISKSALFAAEPPKKEDMCPVYAFMKDGAGLDGVEKSLKLLWANDDDFIIHAVEFQQVRDQQFFVCFVIGDRLHAKRFATKYDGSKIGGGDRTLSLSLNRSDVVEEETHRIVAPSSKKEEKVVFNEDEEAARPVYRKTVDTKRASNAKTIVYTGWLPTIVTRSDLNNVWKTSEFNGKITVLTGEPYSIQRQPDPKSRTKRSSFALEVSGDQKDAENFIEKFNTTTFNYGRTNKNSKTELHLALKRPPLSTGVRRDIDDDSEEDIDDDDGRVFFYGLPKACDDERLVSNFLRVRAREGDYKIKKVELVDCTRHDEWLPPQWRKRGYTCGYAHLDGGRKEAESFARRFNRTKGMHGFMSSIFLMQATKSRFEREGDALSSDDDGDDESDDHSSSHQGDGEDEGNDDTTYECREGECKIFIWGMKWARTTAADVEDFLIDEASHENLPRNLRVVLPKNGLTTAEKKLTGNSITSRSGYLFLEAKEHIALGFARKFNEIKGLYPGRPTKLFMYFDDGGRKITSKAPRQAVDPENRRRRRSRSADNEAVVTRRRSPVRASTRTNNSATTTTAGGAVSRPSGGSGGRSPTMQQQQQQPQQQQQHFPMQQQMTMNPYPQQHHLLQQPAQQLQQQQQPVMMMQPAQQIDPQQLQQQYEAYLRAVQTIQQQQQQQQQQ